MQLIFCKLQRNGEYAMGYSSPKKQLDLKEFLSKPSKQKKPPKKWKRTAMPATKGPSVAETKAKST